MQARRAIHQEEFHDWAFGTCGTGAAGGRNSQAATQAGPTPRHPDEFMQQDLTTGMNDIKGYDGNARGQKRQPERLHGRKQRKPSNRKAIPVPERRRGVLPGQPPGCVP